MGGMASKDVKLRGELKTHYPARLRETIGTLLDWKAASTKIELWVRQKRTRDELGRTVCL
jgi:hypothetical protein